MCTMIAEERFRKQKTIARCACYDLTKLRMAGRLDANKARNGLHDVSVSSNIPT